MEKKKFAFMIHPRTTRDFWRRFGAMIFIGESLGMMLFDRQPFNAIANFLMKYLAVWFPRLGFTNCTPKGFRVDDETEGYIVAVLLTSNQMKSVINMRRKSDKFVKWIHKKLGIPAGRKFVQHRITDAILYAQDSLGCNVVGLGAYTAPMMKDGLAAIADKRITCAITHGDALSAASGYAAVIKASEDRGINIEKATIAVVGASGVVGYGLTPMVAGLNPKKLILTANRRKSVLEDLANVIREQGFDGDVKLTLKTKDITGADIIVLTTTAPGDIVDKDMLANTTIVVDMAQPCNMSQEIHNQVPEILRIDGGYMDISRVEVPFEMGPPKGTSFACLTETMTLTLEGDSDHHVGIVDPEFAFSILEKAKQHGFHLAPFTNFSNPV